MTLNDLKIAYEKARANDQKVFILEGQEILTEYAKYLIAYFEIYLGDQEEVFL